MRVRTLLVLVAHGQAMAQDTPPPLVDKTLVVWAAPANLTQRGGSVLTLEDQREHFDALVFGEIAAGKWMAGSDHFHRSQREQTSVPTETEAKRAVQMALVYRGRQVTLLRDGEVLTQFDMPGEPQEFPAHSLVLIGKRHRRQGDRAHFAGTIDDARIYDRALSAAEIAALEPNSARGPTPWAWWDFANDAKERTGRYPQVELSGGATVADGKLVLDGVSGNLLARSAHPLVFRPETPTRPSAVPADWFTYHLAHPGPGSAFPGDPNCALFYKGRYHLHYIYAHKDGFAFAHLSSQDLVRWRWHPTTLTPPLTGHGMFSGTAFFTRDGRPAIIYHGEGSGRNMIALAEDDLLEKWSTPMPLEPKIAAGQDPSLIAHWDPDAWLEGDTYYALSGGSPGSGKPPTLFRSADLRQWDYLGRFLAHDMPGVGADEDISCPNFFRLGGKWMLLCISHNKGCRYYLGDWRDEKFTPEHHARMNWHGWDCFAPESLLTPDGRRVMWAWSNPGGNYRPGDARQTGLQTLPRELSLPSDGVLRIEPLRELATLRTDERRHRELTIAAATPLVLPDIAGDTLELRVTLRPSSATRVGLCVHADQDGRHGVPITFTAAERQLRVGEVAAPFSLAPSEDLVLRVFLDKECIEVFANDRQAMIARHVPSAERLRVSLISDGASTTAVEVVAWRMRSIYE